MTKGQKLFEFLKSKMDEYKASPVLSPAANSMWECQHALKYLWQMSDTEFEEITKNETDLKKGEIVCKLCNSITISFDVHKTLLGTNPDDFICLECETKVGYSW